jgi:imidazolonepropionase-like amidohydrolase
LFPAQQAGTIAAGKRADIVLLDGNPLDDIRNTRRIRAVVVRGRYLDREALERLLEKASHLARTN